MSESTRISAAQNPAENPSEAAYSDANWQSDFDALNGIQYILYVMAVNTSYVAWSDAIQSALDEISGACQMIRKLNPLRGPFVGLNPSDAAKLIASVAEPLLVLFPQPAQAPDGPGKYIGGTLSWIIGTCKEIDPSSGS